MRYIKHYLTEITGIEIYPIISLLIFTFFFLALFAYIFTMRRQHSQYMGSRPLDDRILETSEELNV